MEEKMASTKTRFMSINLSAISIRIKNHMNLETKESSC